MSEARCCVGPPGLVSQALVRVLRTLGAPAVLASADAHPRAEDHLVLIEQHLRSVADLSEAWDWLRSVRGHALHVQGTPGVLPILRWARAPAAMGDGLGGLLRKILHDVFKNTYLLNNELQLIAAELPTWCELWQRASGSPAASDRLSRALAQTPIQRSRVVRQLERLDQSLNLEQ